MFVSSMKVLHVDRTILKNKLFSISKSHNSIDLGSCTLHIYSLMLVNICIKIHEDTLKGFQVTQLTKDRRPRQKQYVSQVPTLIWGVCVWGGGGGGGKEF